jgi:hypothetical protein
MPNRQRNPHEPLGKRRKPMQTSPDDDEAQAIDQTHATRQEERDWVPEDKDQDEKPRTS